MGAKRIPISAAKAIADDFGQSHVVIMTFDNTAGLTHVITYGKTKTDCEQAAQGGNLVKRALGWPEALCNAQPARAKPTLISYSCSRLDQLRDGSDETWIKAFPDVSKAIAYFQTQHGDKLEHIRVTATRKIVWTAPGVDMLQVKLGPTSGKEPRMSQESRAVLRALLKNPVLFGADLCTACKLRGSTVYPMLKRFSECGWVQIKTERGDPKKLGRPLRKYCRLTPLGRAYAKKLPPEPAHVV